jgi:hypothetical protein
MIYKTKETAIKHLKQGELFSNKSFELFRNYRDCVLEALKIGKSFTHYPQEWLGDVELSRAFIQNVQIDTNIHACFSVGKRLLDDKKFILSCLTDRTYEFLKWVEDKEAGRDPKGPMPRITHSDADTYLERRLNSYELYLACSPRLKEDQDVCSYTLLRSPLSIYFMSEEIRSYPNILLSFAGGLDAEVFHSQDMNVVVRQLGLPHELYEDYQCVDDIYEYIEKFSLSQKMSKKLKNKTTTQSIKI